MHSDNPNMIVLNRGKEKLDYLVLFLVKRSPNLEILTTPTSHPAFIKLMYKVSKIRLKGYSIYIQCILSH